MNDGKDKTKTKIDPGKYKWSVIFDGYWFRKYFMIFLTVLLYSSLLYISYLSYKNWMCRAEVSKYYDTYRTEKSRKFQVLGKLNQTQEGKSSGHLWFLIKDIKTGIKKEVDVTPTVFMSYEKGDYVWFKYEDEDFMPESKIREVRPKDYSLNVGVWMITITVYLCIVLLMSIVMSSLLDWSGKDRFRNKMTAKFSEVGYSRATDYFEEIETDVNFYCMVLPAIAVVGITINCIIYYFSL